MDRIKRTETENAASKMEADNRNDAKSRFAAETKVRDARAAATAKKYAKEAAAANAEEEPIQVTLAKPADEAPAEE
jgi:hypothetical protein